MSIIENNQINDYIPDQQRANHVIQSIRRHNAIIHARSQSKETSGTNASVGPSPPTQWSSSFPSSNGDVNPTFMPSAQSYPIDKQRYDR